MDDKVIIQNKIDSKENVFYFIIFLRLIATCLITNTHYNNVYPSSSIAVGGLLGDVLFFAVSGYCYGNGSKEKSFLVWYVKRIIRIYPAILVMLIINHVGGLWDYHSIGFFSYFVFPTYFRFFASIMIIYIPMYFIGRIKSRKILLSIIIACVCVWLIVYALFLDKSIFFMQATENLSCQFLYLCAALTGMYLRKSNDIPQRIQRKKSIVKAGILVFVLTITYFVATIVIRKSPQFYDIQIIVQLSILFLTIALAVFFKLIELNLRKLPKIIFKIVNFVSLLTLEIYAVQRIIIRNLEFLPFPVNWIVITGLIILSAFILKSICKPSISICNKYIDKCAGKFERYKK